MPNELEKLAASGAIQKHGDLEAFAGAADFLPRLMLLASGSALAIEGKVPAGEYAAIADKENYVKLGAEVDILCCVWRPKAMDVSGDEIISVFDKDSELFKQIQEKSGGKDSGCMYGPEFLVWIKQTKKFATFFMASKTMRREAPKMNQYLTKPVTLRSRLIDPPKSKYKWFGPVVSACSTPFDIPPVDDLKTEIDKFNTPPEQQLEPADATDGRER